MRTNKAKFDPETASAHRHGAFAAMNAMLSDWAKFRRFLRAWVTAGKSHSAACPDRCGAIGYCFGERDSKPPQCTQRGGTAAAAACQVPSIPSDLTPGSDPKQPSCL